MPFKSKAQERFLFSQHPDIAKRWAGETPDIKSLTNRIEKTMNEIFSKKKK